MQAGSSQHPQRGATYLLVLALLALLAVAMARAGPSWAEAARRDRERELLRVGALYAQALASYRDLSPGAQRSYPPTLEALLLDTRFVGTMRHIRRLYADPVNPGKPWGLLRDAQGRVQGVHSLSEAAPVAQGPLQQGPVRLDAAARYSDWKFIAETRP